MSIPSSKEVSTPFCVPSLPKGRWDPNFARLRKEGAERRLFQGSNQLSVDSSPHPAAAPARQLPVLSEEWAAPAHTRPGSCLSLEAGLFISGISVNETKFFWKGPLSPILFRFSCGPQGCFHCQPGCWNCLFLATARRAHPGKKLEAPRPCCTTGSSGEEQGTPA